MDSMFYGCKNLKKIPNLDTSNVLSMSNMFYECKSLKSIPLLNTAKVGYMESMFASSGITNVPKLNTSAVFEMSNMFNYCLELVEVGPLDTSNVISMPGLFVGCSKLKKVELTNVSRATNVSVMFGPIKKPIAGNFSNWSFNKNVNMLAMLSYDIFIDMFGFEATVSNLLNFGKINEFQSTTLLLNKNKKESIEFLKKLILEKMLGIN